MDFRKHLILQHENVKEALNKLNTLAMDAILFVVDEKDILIGSLTDGDIRRGFIKGYTFDTPIMDYIQPDPVFIARNAYSIEQLEAFAQKNLKVIPILDEQHRIVDILNLRIKSSLLPLDTVLMAGGRGERLMPLTESCPKPLLKVGEKPIIEHNVDRLVNYGINRIFISIRYLGHQIREYLGNGTTKDIDIHYIEEDQPLGTFGALSMINTFQTENILLMNSDLLTNIDFSDFYKSFLQTGADLMVASIPYQVKVPYAVLEIDNGQVISFDEKPTYSYYSNGGIYLFRKSLLEHLPGKAFFNATDFMELLISLKKRIVHYPIVGYWLDIGKHEDFERAQNDIKHIKL
ncbi:NTP transferase domain-containing protein [Chitinophaga polysaccharea]|uniref:nucleotidyltransferase family protein n=1 Tax=Chitinophaga polysaccharea TaxID=1293035 RepID=UPI001455A616|nr:nucleotidyltransferase family protein [Chitinophaga polysaccharea]NLR61853.1 NTP transferase domain-containing protein [Chitinophaga polysaccharea]